MQSTGMANPCLCEPVKFRGGFPGHLTSGLNWFDTPEQAGPSALVTFDRGFLGGESAVELASNIRRRNTGAFEFGDVVSVPERHRVRRPADTPRPDIPLEPSGLGVSVVLPEWTASAVGWTLATVVDVARVMAPETENFAVRVAQIEESSGMVALLAVSDAANHG